MVILEGTEWSRFAGGAAKESQGQQGQAGAAELVVVCLVVNEVIEHS